MDAELGATTKRLLRASPTLAPSVVRTFGFEPRIPYLTVARTLAELAREGRLECVDSVTLAYRAPKRRRRTRRTDATERTAAGDMSGQGKALPTAKGGA